MSYYQYSSANGALRVIFHNAVNSAETRKSRGRLDAGQIDIDFDYLLNLWNTQKGTCYYTGMPLNFDKNEWRVSIERKDPSFGYVQRNVVLTCIELNSRAQWSHEKINGIIHYNCTYCDEVKEVDCFPRISHNACKDCLKKREKIYKSYPSIRLNSLYRNTITSTERRKEKKNPKRDCSHDIDLMYVNQLYFEQKGLCDYSKLPLKFEGDDWLCSIERIDVFKGYICDNICLVCREFNVSDFSAVMTSTECGNSGWTELKFQYFLAYIKSNINLISKEELDAIIQLQVVYKSRLELMRTPKQRYSKRISTSKHISSIITQAKRNYGKIYMITSPSGKRFVGQTDIVFKSNESILIDIRRNHHTSVMREMDKYQDAEMKVDTLLVCKKDKLDHYRDYFISEYDTDGLNGLNSSFKHSQKTKQQISNSLIENNKRVGHDGRELSKYVKYHDWKDRKGYAILNHPKCKKKDFVLKKSTLEENYQRCIEFLNQLN